MRFQGIAAFAVVTFCAAAPCAMAADATAKESAIRLPGGAIAFDFGTARPGRGFVGITTRSAAADGSYGFTQGDGLVDSGDSWPDTLSGTFVYSQKGAFFDFRAKVPPGEYDAWLVAGRVVRPGIAGTFGLRVNDKVFYDKAVSADSLDSKHHLYRFLWTQYSERPHAQWRDYVAEMYPAWTAKVRADRGVVTLQAQNFFVSALILLPVSRHAEFEAMTAALEEARIAEFETTAPPLLQPQRPEKLPDDGPYLIYIPDDWRVIRPWTAPTDEERARTELRLAGAPGQRVLCRIAVVPFEDLGACHLVQCDLAGPDNAVIGRENVAGRFLNYRRHGGDVGEMALLPTLRPQVEKGATQSFWIWVTIPRTAAPGVYRGRFSFNPASKPTTIVPIALEVYPFRLAQDLPAAFGMYFDGRKEPEFAEGERREGTRCQLEWMRAMGLNAVTLPGPSLAGVSEQVRMHVDATLWELAKEAGMGRRPEQECIADARDMGRAIGRLRLGLGSVVDREPGAELEKEEFREQFLEAAEEFGEFAAAHGLAVAVSAAGESRAASRPAGLDAEDTNAYGDMLEEALAGAPSVRTLAIASGDADAGGERTALVDHHDIVAVSAATSSADLAEKARAAGKTLWLADAGMDRLSWGFYVWRVRARGRWERHWSAPSADARGGYPGREWYNPFTGLDGYATNAPPAEYPGGFLFKSALLEASEGITDYAYLVTLEQALAKAEKEGRSPDAVAGAKAFLALLEVSIPPFLEGYPPGSAEAAQVDTARRMCGAWRLEAAEHIIRLSR